MDYTKAQRKYWQDDSWRVPSVTREWHKFARKQHEEWRKTSKAKKAIHGLLVRQHYKCFYCDCSLNNVRYEVDHIKPLWKGGMNHTKNMCVACAPCNQTKGANLVFPEAIKARNKELKIKDHSSYKMTDTRKNAKNNNSEAYKIAKAMPTWMYDLF